MDTVDKPITINFDKEIPENAVNAEDADVDKEIPENAVIAEDAENVEKEIKDCLANIKGTENLIYELINLKLTPKKLNFSEIKMEEIIKLKDDKPIEKFLNFCVKKCIKDNDPGFMFEVADKLPRLADTHYSPVANLIKQITYVKIPSTQGVENTFNSTKENLWSYKFPNPKSSPSLLDRFERSPEHFATLCYVPLPGLCTYEKPKNMFFDLLVPHCSSLFVKLSFSNNSEIFEASQVSSKLFESPPFQAIVKFKWHAFARLRFFVFFIFYILYFSSFTAAISGTTRSTPPMIVSMVMGTIILLGLIRYGITNAFIGTGRRFLLVPSTYFILSISVLPIATGFHELYNNNTPSVLRLPSIIVLWICFIVFLCVFKNIGTFLIVIVHICREILWLLIVLTLVLFASAHSMMVLPSITSFDGKEEFSEFSNTIKYVWFAFLGDYGPWPNNPWFDIGRVAFSFFSSILILNILIALVNNVYNDVRERAYTEWTTVRLQMIVMIELVTLLPSERQREDYFPKTILYEAATEKVDEWPSKLKEENIPIPWEEEDHKSDSIKALYEMTDNMKCELSKIEEKVKFLTAELQKK